eukprot:COSAG04_NODE_10991_length_739_cov_0.671875_1_plen_81_part_00
MSAHLWRAVADFRARFGAGKAMPAIAEGAEGGGPGAPPPSVSCRSVLACLLLVVLACISDPMKTDFVDAFRRHLTFPNFQ